MTLQVVMNFTDRPYARFIDIPVGKPNPRTALLRWTGCFGSTRGHLQGNRLAMQAAELVNALKALQTAGLTSGQLTQLQHFSIKGRRVSLPEVISYFSERGSIHGNNLSFAARCIHIANRLGVGGHDLRRLVDDALAQFPHGSPYEGEVRRPIEEAPGKIKPVAVTPKLPSVPVSKRLGDLGEHFALALLQAKGYKAELLTTNYPSYDIKVTVADKEFFVSVKASRTKQHVRLGARRSVDRLSKGNFVFAFLPNTKQEIEFTPGGYQLLIIPAELARLDGLSVHDAYWAQKGDADQYSVMVKGYDRSHCSIWFKWKCFDSAWNLLPEPNLSAK